MVQKKLKTILSSDLLHRVLQLVTISGVTLASITLLQDRDIGLDEAMLSVNIIDKSYSQLLQPLDMHQVASIGFLFISKFFSNIFGGSDLVLRLLPFLSYLFAIPLVLYLGRNTSESKLVSWIATSLYSISVQAIYYATEVKQYSTDVFVCLLILSLAKNYTEIRNGKSTILFAIIGGITIWFSNVAIIVLSATGLVLLFYFFQKKKSKIAQLLIIGSIWTSSFLIYYSHFIRNHPSNEYMTSFWADSFLPTNVFSIEFYTFLWQQLKTIGGELMNFGHFWYVPLVIMTIGLAYLIRSKKYLSVMLLILPLVVHLILSALSLYPFSIRLYLYLLPLFFIVFSNGIYGLQKCVSNIFFLNPIYYSLVLIPVLTLYYPIFKSFPMEKQSVNAPMKELNHNIKYGDRIFVLDSWPQFYFYLDKYDKLTEDIAIPITYYASDWQAYNDLINNTTGKLWIIHLTDDGVPRASQNAVKYFRNVLNENNYKEVRKERINAYTLISFE